MSDFSIPPKGSQGFRGYNSDASNAPYDMLAPPCINCMIDTNGKAGSRQGFSEETGIDLGVANKPARSFYIEKYDITVFTLGTYVKYYDWNNNTVYDTGLTLTTGTICRGDQFEGDLDITNTTDGMRRLVFFRLRGDAAAGITTLNADYDGVARLERMGKTSGNIIIQGTTEAFSATTTAAGTLTTTALTKAYLDNAVAVVVHDISGVSGIEKASDVFFWKRRLGMYGSEVAGNSDVPNNTIYYGQFSAPTTIETIIVFDYTTLGSTREHVGNYGRVTNVVPVKDFLYQFTDAEGYATAASDVIITGTGIGMTTPDLKDEVHGCLNEDSSCVIGNNEVAYITNDKRIMRIKVATDSGAAVVFPDELFDLPMRNHLVNMDEDQTGAMAVYYKAKRQSIYQVSISGQWYWLIYDHSIKNYVNTAMGAQIIYGAWQPPQQVIQAYDFFERKGTLYATDSSDDTVYSIFTAFDDNLVPISWTFATGNFNTGNAYMKRAVMQGEISQAAIIKAKALVTNRNGGQQSTSDKIIDGSTFTYSAAHGIGADAIGAGGVEANTISITDWQTEFDIYPSEANKVQLQASNEEGGYCSVSSFSLVGTQYPHSFSNAL